MGGGGALGPLSGGVEGEGALRVMNTTHALTAVINAAKQSMGIWVLSNDICYLLAPVPLVAGVVGRCGDIT
ncbi:hypothetical protein D934_05255 [Xylella fastidiosa subsp. sandyi Ann-1]|uniref:Uncharacterized protein n=1 Tax=Xylella fastidiosa subsp. sandyi Ann-1 TaxID=155920 RepID=A0A060HCM8_XYLFS|nr:hypothetical protein D934_05255 [Xylella fastidiosa subsp. sandyi Ann-1]